MKLRHVFLWGTPAILGGLLIGLLTARAMEPGGETTYWNRDIAERVRELVGSEYVDEIPPEVQRRLFYEAMEAYLSGLDEYCSFYDPEERHRMEVENRGQFGGVGILVQPAPPEGGLRVTGLRAGDPAEAAGMEIGDRIVTVDGEPITALSLDEITTRIKGLPGTEVKLGVVRNGETMEFRMYRSEIKVDSVRGVRILDAEHGVGYLHVVLFQENTGEDAREALRWLKEHGARSFVLDLRQNPGGVLEKGAVALVDLFLDEGVIVKTAGRGPGSRRVYEATPEGTVVPDAPLVVLVDGGSASAAEVVAGAFQDHRRGILVGQRTYGKFLVQSIHVLVDDTAMKLTTARYYTPYGRWLQRRNREGIRGGLLPDVVVDRSKEEEEALARTFVAEHGLDMRVEDKEAAAAAGAGEANVVDGQLARAVQILADYATMKEDGSK